MHALLATQVFTKYFSHETESKGEGTVCTVIWVCGAIWWPFKNWHFVSNPQRHISTPLPISSDNATFPLNYKCTWKRICIQPQYNFT